MLAVVFPVYVLMMAWLTGCAAWSIRFPERRTWPPRHRSGFVYRVSSICGPGMNFVFAAIALLGWNTLGAPPWLRFGVGGLLFSLGAYLSLDGVFRLGMHRTQGNVGALEASGSYLVSRNPQYTGAMFATVSIALLFDSTPGLVAAALAFPWFLLLPFVEEPWLREQLGAPYEAYAARVPRFLSLRSLFAASAKK